MTHHEEIITKIRAMTEKNIAYAAAHADEINAKIEANRTDAENKIAQILDEAKHAVKRSYSVYDGFRSRIANAASSSEQFETAVIRLARTLGI